MRQFNKLVAIEPVSLTKWGVDEINKMAKEVIQYNDIPSDDDEIVSRIGDADAVLLSYTSQLTANAMKRCPNIKYVGMCCSHSHIFYIWATLHGVGCELRCVA